VSNLGHAAGLLHLQALHQRQHRYVPIYDYLPGPTNLMSGDCSQRFNLLYLPTVREKSLRANLNVVDAQIRSRVTSKRDDAIDKNWGHWEQLGLEHNVDPYLRNVNLG
jgi:hypothetical protein